MYSLTVVGGYIDLVVSPVPEPSTLALLAAAAAGLVGLRGGGQFASIAHGAAARGTPPGREGLLCLRHPAGENFRGHPASTGRASGTRNLPLPAPHQRHHAKAVPYC